MCFAVYICKYALTHVLNSLKAENQVMPFTPFHFGPGILLGLLLLRYLDFPTFVAANVMIDWRAALVFLDLMDGPLHGWVHTYLGHP